MVRSQGFHHVLSMRHRLVSSCWLLLLLDIWMDETPLAKFSPTSVRHQCLSVVVQHR